MGASVSGGGGSGRGSSLGGSAMSMLAARRQAGGNGTLSEINVTPFVDVVLVLLIIFMITAPMLMRAMDVSLPSASIRRDQAEERTIVTLDAQGRTFIDDKAVNLALLEEEMRMRVEVQGMRIAYLRADETLQYKQIIRVMDLMKRAGVDTVGLAYVYPEEKKDGS
jgi:biopolymer transport protein TolR